MISHLSRHHSVVVASLTRSDKERKGVSALEEQCAGVITAPIGRTAAWARMLLALPTPRPSTFGYFSSPALARRLRKVAAEQRFDLVIAHRSSVGPYAAAVDGVPKILDFCTHDSRNWLAARDQTSLTL